MRAQWLPRAHGARHARLDEGRNMKTRKSVMRQRSEPQERFNCKRNPCSAQARRPRPCSYRHALVARVMSKDITGAQRAG